MVYGDYDVDGTTAVALVYKFLRHIGHRNLLFYIPDRYTEGYGISVKGNRLRRPQGGDAHHRPRLRHQSHGEGSLCEDSGRGFHHLRPSPPPAEEIPRAVAVLDPKRTDCTYPFDELSGCGVGFKLVQAYAMKKRDAFFVNRAAAGPAGGEHRLGHRAAGGRKPHPGPLRARTAQPRAVEGSAVDHQDLRTEQALDHHRRHRLQDRAAHQRRRPYADGRKRRKRRAVGRIRRREPARREQRERRRRLRVDHRRLQPGPQVDRPPRDAGGARDHRERPRTEKTARARSSTIPGG